MNSESGVVTLLKYVEALSREVEQGVEEPLETLVGEVGDGVEECTSYRHSDTDEDMAKDKQIAILSAKGRYESSDESQGVL